MEEIHGSSGTKPQQVACGQPPIDVRDEAGLIRALNPLNAGRTILVKPGTYGVGVPLTVPDRATLQGAGMMLFDGLGLPDRFDPQIPTTTITASSGFKGNLLILGNGCKVKKLVLRGASQVGLDEAGRGGNVVAVASRTQQESLSATIEECELNNKSKSDAATDVPTGRDPRLHAQPPTRRRSAAARGGDRYCHGDPVNC
jgi:hypothetical protein